MEKNNLEYIKNNTKFKCNIINLAKKSALLITINKDNWEDLEELCNIYNLLTCISNDEEYRLLLRLSDDNIDLLLDSYASFQILWNRIAELDNGNK